MIKQPVLIVDDEPIVRESIADWLKDAGYQVATAESGEEALQMIEQQDFGVVIMYIRLPGKTGIQVLREIKTAKPQIKSIIITAYSSAELAEEAKKVGAVDFLIKPIAIDELEKLIQITLSQI